MSTDDSLDRASAADQVREALSAGDDAAGPLRRALATLLDIVLFTAASLVLVLPAIRAIDWAVALSGADELTRAVSEPTTVDHVSSVAGMWIAMWWCYFIVGWGLLGATPGKWVFGIRIVDYRGRCPIGAWRAVLRLFAYMVSSVTLGAGHALMLLRSDRRALHDILAGTRVVRRRRRGTTTPQTAGSKRKESAD